jgi:hypothetical protein
MVREKTDELTMVDIVPHRGVVIDNIDDRLRPGHVRRLAA